MTAADKAEGKGRGGEAMAKWRNGMWAGEESRRRRKEPTAMAEARPTGQAAGLLWLVRSRVGWRRQTSDERATKGRRTTKTMTMTRATGDGRQARGRGRAPFQHHRDLSLATLHKGDLVPIDQHRQTAHHLPCAAEILAHKSSPRNPRQQLQQRFCHTLVTQQLAP